jgi:alpha-beta hydrolase superfamily lysophospholipase
MPQTVFSAQPPQPETAYIGPLPLYCELHEAGPDDPLVLFLPGIATHTALYRDFLDTIARQGFNVVGVDLRGHGRSNGDRGLFTVDQVVADVSAIIDHYETRFPGPVALLGYSLGSPLALAAAEADGRVKALVCHTLMLGSHPPDWFHYLGWQALGWTSLTLPHWRVNLRSLLDVDRLMFSSRHAAWIAEDGLLVWDYPVKTLASVFGHRHRVHNEQLAFRSVVLTGEEDEVVRPTYTKTLLARLTHRFESEVLTGMSHMAPFVHTEALAATSARWLRRLLNGKRR